MLRTLVLEDMTFGVFPYMAAYFTHPWYYDVDEVFDAVLQLLQVCKKLICPCRILLSLVSLARDLSFSIDTLLLIVM